MRLHTHLTLLTMTTALMATSVSGLWAQDSAPQGSGIDLSGKAQSLDITTHVGALHGMTIVNHQGKSLGQLNDLVIDFSNGEVIYALMSAGGGQQQTQQRSQGEQRGSQSGGGSGQEQTAGAEQGQSALYPIPIDALQIVDRAALEPEVAQGEQQTGQAQQQEAATQQQQPQTSQRGYGQQQQQQTDQNQQQDRTASRDQEEQQQQSLSEMRVGDVIGMEVRSKNGESIDDVEAIIRGSDAPALAVIGVGGFLGIGEKSVGVSIDRLSLTPEGDALVLSVTREQLEDSPELEYDSSQTVPEDMQVAQLTDTGPQAQQQSQAAQPADQNARGQQGQQPEEAISETRQGQTSRQAGRITTLEDKVLMVAITQERLQQAPSFQEGNFPAVSEPEWQRSVLAFYKDLLNQQGSGAADTEMSPTSDNDEENPDRETAR